MAQDTPAIVNVAYYAIWVAVYLFLGLLGLVVYWLCKEDKELKERCERENTERSKRRRYWSEPTELPTPFVAKRSQRQKVSVETSRREDVSEPKAKPKRKKRIRVAYTINPAQGIASGTFALIALWGGVNAVGCFMGEGDFSKYPFWFRVFLGVFFSVVFIAAAVKAVAWLVLEISQDYREVEEDVELVDPTVEMPGLELSAPASCDEMNAFNENDEPPYPVPYPLRLIHKKPWELVE